METKKIQDYSDIAVTNLDPEKAKIVNERGIELQRLKKQVEAAIKKAEELGRSDMVKKLEAREQQLDTLLKGKTFKDIISGNTIGSDSKNNDPTKTDNKDTDNKNQADQKEPEQSKDNSTKTPEKNTEADTETDETSSDSNNNEENTDQDEDSLAGNNSSTTEPQDDETTLADSESNDDTDTDTDNTDSEVKAEEKQDDDDTGSKDALDKNSDENAEDATEADESDHGQNSNQNSSTQDQDNGKSHSNDDAAQDTAQNQSDETDEDKSADEDDIVNDIFQRPENTKQQFSSQSQASKKESRDPTIDEIIKELQSISKEGKRGAAKALKDILANRGVTDFSESLNKKVLKEAIEDKALEDIDDEEFSDFVNTVLDEINNITPVAYSDPDERKVKVKQAMENNLETRDIEMEQEMQVRADKRRKRANQSELDKYVNYRPISEFYIDLYRTIADQVKQVEIDNQSYDEINPEYDDDVIMKADVTQYEQRQEKPSIDFFFDVSGSWEDSDVELGKRFVSSLKEFVDRDELELNMYYFSDIVGQDLESVRNYGGTTAWTKILDTIKSNNAKNVVVMTDGDMDIYAARSGQKCLVEGVVWYIWKIGGYYTTGAKELPKYLKGMQGTTQYAFNEGDV